MYLELLGKEGKRESGRVIVRIITLTTSSSDLTIISIPIEIFLIILIILIILVISFLVIIYRVYRRFIR